MTNAIELNHISKSFGEFSLKDVTLAVPAGTICGLVGENGAGKSTLIRILMGALRPDSGAAVTLGADVSAPDFLRVKEDIGVVLDEGCFPETLTAPQVGRVMAATYRRWEQDTFDAYCRRFGLPEKTAFKDYSRGMKMKLTIAVALSHQAQLLVLDEATAGLDPIVRDEILELFNEFTRDETHSVLISSHILSDLEKLCDYIAFLHQGRLLFCEEKDALLEQYGIFNDTAEQAEALMPEAIVSMETTPYGGVGASGQTCPSAENMGGDLDGVGKEKHNESTAAERLVCSAEAGLGLSHHRSGLGRYPQRSTESSGCGLRGHDPLYRHGL